MLDTKVVGVPTMWQLLAPSTHSSKQRLPLSIVMLESSVTWTLWKMQSAEDAEHREWTQNSKIVKPELENSWMNSEMGIREVDESLKVSLMTTTAKATLQFDMDINMSGCSLIWTSTCLAGLAVGSWQPQRWGYEVVLWESGWKKTGRFGERISHSLMEFNM